jgi:hypothetical protein
MPIIPGIWEVEIRRIMVQNQPREEVSNTPSTQTSQTWWYIPVIPATQEAQDNPRPRLTQAKV